jgi:uncharacterized membrane protein YdbT with pleckstrin-like domain
MKVYCSQCGADNSEKAVFCRKCGLHLETEEETRVVTRVKGPGLAVEAGEPQTPFEDSREVEEREIFSICPTLLFVKLGYAATAAAAILLVAITAAFTTVGSLWAIVAGLLLFLVPGFYHFKQKLVRYTLTESKLEIDKGLISRRTQNVPIRRIQDVTVTMSMIQRLLGIGSLIVDNASDDGGKVIMENINDPRKHADILLKQMKRLER